MNKKRIREYHQSEQRSSGVIGAPAGQLNASCESEKKRRAVSSRVRNRVISRNHQTHWQEAQR